MSSLTPRRLPIVLTIVALLAAGGLADRAGRPAPAGAREQSPFAMPVAAPTSALSSTWYCAGGTSQLKGFADGWLVLANSEDRTVHVVVTFIPNDPSIRPRLVPVDVKPLSQLTLHDFDYLQAQFVAATVEVRGGGVVAEHFVLGPGGASVAPCASSASDRWYFADGGTTRDATELLALFNPFPEDAIVDLSFTTEAGGIEPEALQALVVPGRGLSVVNVGDHVVRRRAVSVSIVARSGRLVADRIQSYSGSAGRRGLALVLGTPSPGTLWYFPEGLVTKGVVERYQLYNPSDQEAKVELALGLEKGAAEPFDLTVPGGGRITVLANAEGRIPAEVPHSATVRSVNGVGVVVERSIDATKPSPRRGLGSTLGARQSARRWLFAIGLATDTVDEWLVLQNPGTHAATVSVTALADGQQLAIDGLQDVRLAPGRRMAFRLGDHLRRDPLPLLVTSTEPVVAERDLYTVGGLGMSTVMGVPLR